MTRPTPREVWVALAPLLAARNSMRVSHGRDTGYDQGRRLATVNLPTLPAAVPLFTAIRRTSVLGLDFDIDKAGHDQVKSDVADATALITAAGGRLIIDRSPRGGMHIWIPLWAHADLCAATLRPTLDAMRRRWPSLDITPMTNPRTGCLTAPGSACLGGGHRELLTPLPEAIAAATERSPQGTLAALNTALGVVTSATPSSATASHTRPRPSCDVRPAEAPAPIRSPHALTFATTGQLPGHRPQWTRSHARQSVLVHAVLRHWELEDVEHKMGTGQWPGMVESYGKYGVHCRQRLATEWEKAQRWVESTLDVQDSPHKHQHTGGTDLHRWLRHAITWAHTSPHLRGQHRTTAADVLQALAYAARLTRSMVVSVGGRWLSIAAGLLNERTIWTTLRQLREIDGSPISRVRTHVGRHADEYSLTLPVLPDGVPEPAAEPGYPIEPVSPVWKIIGHRARWLFELLDTHYGLKPGVRIRTRIVLDHGPCSRAAVYDALALLVNHGLCTTGHGWISRTTLTLADLARYHHVDQLVARRVELHRQQRRIWWDLLATWHAAATIDCPPSEQLPEDPLTTAEHETWLAIVMATGPPDDSAPHEPAAEYAADDLATLLADALGAAPLAADVMVPA